MIEHIFIKNYKAFERENIPLDKHTLLIGSYHSGKTTVLEALDLFFNEVLRHDYIRDRDKDVVIEVHIDDERYRKVWSPPDYYPNFRKSIGNMFAINHIKYLYVPRVIHDPKLINDILTINMTERLDGTKQSRIAKVADYIDGILGNSNYPIFQVRADYKMAIEDDLDLERTDYTKLLSNITYQHLIIGIDNVEDNFNIDSLERITTYSYQTIYATNDADIVTHHEYYVAHLYKGDQSDDYEVIKKRLANHRKTYLLVEGKYDVNWFETALRLLHLDDAYTVIPCGGYGNITFVQEQLEKEGYKTIAITDGDAHFEHALKRDVIELYADVDFVNRKFHTDFKTLPKSKYAFFNAFTVKDDIVKNVLSRWAKHNLTKDHDFVRDVAALLKE